MISLVLFLAAAAVVFVGEVVADLDFAHIAWSLFLAYLGLAARGVDLH